MLCSLETVLLLAVMAAQDSFMNQVFAESSAHETKMQMIQPHGGAYNKPIFLCWIVIVRVYLDCPIVKPHIQSSAVKRHTTDELQTYQWIHAQQSCHTRHVVGTHAALCNGTADDDRHYEFGRSLMLNCFARSIVADLVMRTDLCSVGRFQTKAMPGC